MKNCFKSAKFYDFKSEFKSQIVLKFDLGLLDAYKLCILIEISVKISLAKKSEGSYLSCVANEQTMNSILIMHLLFAWKHIQMTISFGLSINFKLIGTSSLSSEQTFRENTAVSFQPYRNDLHSLWKTIHLNQFHSRNRCKSQYFFITMMHIIFDVILYGVFP